VISIPRRFFIFSIAILFLAGWGCIARPGEQNAGTVTPFTITVTLPPTLTLIPSGTPSPPPPQPTMAPVEGTASTQVNVRSEPSTAAGVIGIIPANTRLEIVGRDPGGNWWQILYPQAIDGKGWVTAQYVITAGQSEVPVIGGGGADLDNGSVAIVQQQINVRSGPGTGFDSLGTLNAQDVVNLTGKDANGAWLQIAFRAGPDGKGWVNAAFVRADGVEKLPIITDSGEVIGTGTPTGSPFTPTPTVIPAWMDNDSQTAPAASVVFEASGTNTLIYSGDVSVPAGDLQDWLQFIPHTGTVFVSLECTASTSLKIDLLENDQPANLEITCGDHVKSHTVKAGSTYLMRLSATQSDSGLQYVSYTVTIQSSP
jgi:uncharacterized protein YraI